VFVQLPGTWGEFALRDPPLAVLAQLLVARVGCRPLPFDDLALDDRQPALGLTLGLEGVRRLTLHLVRPEVPRLPPSRGELADVAEPPPALLAVRHHATSRRYRRSFVRSM